MQVAEANVIFGDRAGQRTIAGITPPGILSFAILIKGLVRFQNQAGRAYQGQLTIFQRLSKGGPGNRPRLFPFYPGPDHSPSEPGNELKRVDGFFHGG